MKSFISYFVTAVLFAGAAWAAEPRTPTAVDFRYSPPEWQAAICLPDDPQKSLVGKSGELLYHYYHGGREFGTRIGVEVTAKAVWQKQDLLSPRVPILRTFRTAPGWEIVEEAFAVTDLPQSPAPAVTLQRVDGDEVNRDWANPAGDLDPSLRDIALHNDGALRFEVAVTPGDTRRIALALCEGYWNEPGKRVQVLSVEGEGPKTVDTVANIGRNKAAAFWFDAKDVNGDGKIEIIVAAAPEGSDKNTILNGLWIFPAGMKTDGKALLAGKLNSHALARLNAAAHAGPARNDMILVQVKNTGAVARTYQPRLIVDTTLGAHSEGQRIVVNNHETVTCSLKIVTPADEKHFQLESVTVPPGETARFFVLYSGGGTIVTSPSTLEQALAARERAVAYWEKAPLPWGRVQVPDAGIQALVDSSIRNIWQAREIKDGLPVFQVGPTCYRGLWIVDGAFLLEAATILGAGDQARNGVAYELTHQKPDGRIEVMGNYWKENGIVLWTCVRHAQLTQDKAWLRSVWPKLQRIARFIKLLRKMPAANGLQPPGFADGGIGGIQYEYTNVYWNLLGLRSFIQGADWLGKGREAAEWQEEYDDFMATFRKAAALTMKTDPFGNRYLPIRMDGEDLPQRGQWGFCHGVYPGQLFAKDDPLVAGNMEMLEDTEHEDMVYGTGWDATGIWNYFASFYGHAWLWQGNGRKAAEVLYAFANHASPVLDWREEQSLKGKPYRKVGDMPHNWASAEFIRLTVHLLALDRGDELHLLEGMPAQWLGAGMTTKLDGIATPFGPLHMTVQVSKDGGTATLEVQPLAANCRAIVVHTPDMDTLQIPPQKGGKVSFPVKAAKNVSGTLRVPLADGTRSVPNTLRQTGATRALHARPCEPLLKPELLPLPIGAVEPQGWLRDWAQSARNGITGHLDEWHPTFADGWKGIPIQAPGAGAEGTGWPLEQSAYWLDGAIRLGLVLHDDALVKKIRARLDPVVEGVHKAAPGTSFIYWKKGCQPQGFDSWAHSQMGRALVALYQGTGDRRVLDALVKVYAEYEGSMGHVDFHDVTGLCNLDAMLETYSFSGDGRILERVCRAVAQPAVAKQFSDWEAGQLAPGHMDIMYEDIRLPAIVYPWTGDEHLLRASLAAWKWLDENHQQPYGVASGEEYASGVGPFRKTETCDVTSMLLAASWLYRVQGNGAWGDRMERAFFNAGAAPVARDFQSMCYYQSPNRLRSDSLPAAQPHSPAPNGILFNKLGCPQVLCCVGAVNRIIPNYIIHMWMGTRDNGLAATLYGPCSVSALVGDGVAVTICTTTDYPFGETIRMNVEPAKAAAFPLYLRIPGWCRDAHVGVNGSALPATPDGKGFVKIARIWAKGDVVELRLPMSPRVVRGHETEVPSANRQYFGYRSAEYFQPRRVPYASVLYGPLLFSLPVPDVDPNMPVADAKWQYALDTDAARRRGGVTVERKAMPAHWDWPLESPVVLRVPVRSFDWQPTDVRGLPAGPVRGGAAAVVGLVPYGCTKFRISMFPVTEQAK